MANEKYASLEVYVSLRGNGMHGIAVATTESKAIEQVTELITSQAAELVWQARESGVATLNRETVRVFKVIANISSFESFQQTNKAGAIANGFNASAYESNESK